MLAAAWDAGIRHYDTAPHYGAGLAEHRLGNALRGRPRDAYTLSTKVGRLLRAAPDTREMSQGFLHALPFRRTFDYTAAGTIRSLEDSHQRMGLNRFDIVYIHDCAEDWHGTAWKDRFTEAMAGAAQVLTAMRNRGEIRAWGMGLNLVEPALACLEAARPDIFLIAGRYTLLDHTALERLFPACAAKGVKVVLGGPYNSGLLAGGTTFNYVPAKARHGGPRQRHPRHLRTPRHRHQGCGAAVLRGPSGRRRRHTRPAHRRRSAAERRPHAGRDPRTPLA